MSSQNIEYISGDISYQHLVGGCPSTYYGIKVDISTKYNSKDSIFIYFGDGTQGYIKRYTSLNIGNHITKSIYTTTHAYGCGTYEVSYIDTIINQSIKNLGTYDTTYFFLSANVVLNSFYPHNDSYLQYNTPALKIYKNKPFNFNTVTSTNNALEYDSITHAFVNNLNAYNLYLPSGVKINRTSGELQWLNPDTLGAYSFVINTNMYKDGNNIESSIHHYKFEVINQNPSYIYDSINHISVSANNFKEIVYTAGNTYSFSVVYTDLSADSIKLITYPIDFFETSPNISILKNNTLKSTLTFLWSPLAIDERIFPYNFILQSVSYYPNDSISNSYQTVSFISRLLNGINDKLRSEKEILIYPNPANSILNISNEQNQLQNSTIRIKNPLGQTVYSSPFRNQIDISLLSSGIYFLTIEDRSNKKTVKIIKND
ncbi:MAG: T9SS type A sorting domain-containing protein [Bacteroidetes bacterium]|nr:T9SS type A sorting domain-containing protein [Bacteroidota bacterium]